MFSKILFPTDFSEVAAKTRDFICSLNSVEAKEVVIVNVINQRLIDSLDTNYAVIFHDGRYQDGRYREDPEEIKQRFVNQRMERLAVIGEALEKAGFKVKTLVRVGNPRKEILKLVAQENVSVIVMGSHGRSNIGEMLIGSVAEKVVRRSPVNVVVIKR